MGGRKSGFQNLGPIGCMPAAKASLGISSEYCGHEPSVIAKMYNIALPKLLKKIQRQLPGFKYALYDYYTTLAERTLNSTKFGNLPIPSKFYQYLCLYIPLQLILLVFSIIILE